ncbi:MAG: hypothetical protein GX418_08815 [Clostridiales bacterium]|nr:hypothetical protein [Clostridiales bacterium]
MDRNLLRGLALTLAAFAAILLLLLAGVGQIDARSADEQAVSLRETVLRAVMTCYAVEGRYPADAAYLCEHYGLTYDRQRFAVVLDAFAENILPDISVLSVGEA